MADPDHLKKLREGVDAWNAWREGNPTIKPDLSGPNLTTRMISEDFFGVNLSGANLVGAVLTGALLIKADLSGANLSGAYLSAAILGSSGHRRTDLSDANLSGANLNGAILVWAILVGADLSGADLRDANLMSADLTGAILTRTHLQGADLHIAVLSGANLVGADLSGANLRLANLNAADLPGASLTYANLVSADIRNADLTGCYIHGVSAWELKLNDKTRQQDLIITPKELINNLRKEPIITVDNIEVGQFIYLMLNNQKIREVIDAITSKVVLILGRFTEERKAVLDAMRGELRNRNYLPVLFDFDKPTSETTVETITLLARMARFVIADISDAKSVLQELQAIVPDLPSLPVQPVIISSQEEPGMFDFFRRYPWVLPVHPYDTPEQLIGDISERVIKPSETKAAELRTDH